MPAHTTIEPTVSEVLFQKTMNMEVSLNDRFIILVTDEFSYVASPNLVLSSQITEN